MGRDEPVSPASARNETRRQGNKDSPNLTPSSRSTRGRSQCLRDARKAGGLRSEMPGTGGSPDRTAALLRLRSTDAQARTSRLASGDPRLVSSWSHRLPLGKQPQLRDGREEHTLCCFGEHLSIRVPCSEVRRLSCAHCPRRGETPSATQSCFTHKMSPGSAMCYVLCSMVQNEKAGASQNRGKVVKQLVACLPTPKFLCKFSWPENENVNLVGTPN